MAAFMNARPAGDEDFDSDDDGFNFDNAYSSTAPFDDTQFMDLQDPKLPISSSQQSREITDTTWNRQEKRILPFRDKHGSLLVGDDLRTVIAKGNLEGIKNFVQEGVSVDFRLRDGWTCLMYAASSGKPEIVEYLLENKANPNFTSDLFTPLLAACCCTTSSEDQILSCVKQLLQYGARINSHDRHFMTALMFAAKSGLASVVGHLIECKCDINKQDDRGWTALCYATAGGYISIVKLLLENKAKTKIKCSEGTLSDIAYNSGHEKLAEFIEQNENPERVPSNKDETDGSGQMVKNTLKTGQKYKRYGDLELLLFGLNLGNLIPLFHQQQLDFTTFLQMNEHDLEKVGIKELGTRKKIMKSIHEIHKKKWEPGSIRTPNSKVLSCRDSVDIIENINKHTSYITSTVNYVRKNLRDHSSLVSQKVDKNLVEKLSKETAESLVKVKGLHIELKQLNKHISEVTSNMDMVPADLVEEPESRRSLWLRRVIPSMITLTFTVATIWMKPSHMSTALITATIFGLRPPPFITAGVATWFFYWTTQTEPFSIDWFTRRFS